MNLTGAHIDLVKGVGFYVNRSTIDIEWITTSIISIKVEVRYSM
jgi:hypothetical protein